MAVSLKMNPSGVVRVVGPAADAAAYRAAQRVRGYAMANIQRTGRIDTGRMIAGLQVRRTSGTAIVSRYKVYSSAPYTIYQENGTRAHGPRRAPFMVFVPKGGTQLVYARWVRGVTPAHFMRDAFERASVSDFTA